jgi:molybdate transport system ATP-binding protein
LNPAALISLEHVTVRVGQRQILPDTTWQLRSGQHWVVLGANGSGKSSLVRCLIGELPAVEGRLIRHDPTLRKERIGYVSFELHQRLIGRDTARDAARAFSGRFNDYGTVESLLGPAAQSPEASPILALMQLEALLTRPLRYLSSGEMRKALIARALLRGPKLLILDEPYEGLDIDARKHLSSAIDDLIRSGIPTIIVTHRFDEIPRGITHVCGLKEGRVIVSGPRESVLTPETVARLYPESPERDTAAMPAAHQAPEDFEPDVLVEIRKATVTYGNRRIFHGLDWTVRHGQHWALLGPNGSGKSSLLELITGDNLQGYANDIYLFGRKKGTGESLWEIRQRIGLVSQRLQVGYQAAVTGAEVVVSGFFDSIGLYRKASF